MGKTLDILKKSKIVEFNTLVEEYCNDYDKVAAEGNSESLLRITIETRADYVIVASPLFKNAEDALAWRQKLDYVDDDMSIYIGYMDEYQNLCHIARLS